MAYIDDLIRDANLARRTEPTPSGVASDLDIQTLLQSLGLLPQAQQLMNQSISPYTPEGGVQYPNQVKRTQWSEVFPQRIMPDNPLDLDRMSPSLPMPPPLQMPQNSSPFRFHQQPYTNDVPFREEFYNPNYINRGGFLVV